MTLPLTAMKVLAVDDNLANLEVIQGLLEQAGYTRLRVTSRPETVVAECNAWRPDLVLLDLHMPARSGYEVLADLRELMREPENLPILVVTADGTPAARHRALSMGARDFISKPIDHGELLLRVRNLLQTRQLQHQLEARNAALDEAVRERTLELEEARHESLTILAAVAEYYDDDTMSHTQRVGRSAAMIAHALGEPAGFVRSIRDAAPLHDIGKIGISRRLLLKPEALTPAEFEEMKRHVEIGASILDGAHSPVLRLATEIVLTHHENWDGSGYPKGLAGEAIALSGRITAVADVFDALTHERPYKPAWAWKQAEAEIRRLSGNKFDPTVVQAFMAVLPRILDGDAAVAVQRAA